MLSIIGVSLLGVFLAVTPAFAHVVVRPGEVGVGERTNFVVSVPTEEDTPTTQVRLLIPEQLQSIRPNVKPGWSIELVRSGEGENSRVSEIIWYGGSIPPDQRDEFVFSSQAPGQAGELVWKAYQTYASGNVSQWEASPEEIEEYETNNPESEGSHDPDAPRPYSVTTVVDDLSEEQTTTTDQTGKADNAFTLSIFAVLLSAGALGMQFYRKK